SRMTVETLCTKLKISAIRETSRATSCNARSNEWLQQWTNNEPGQSSARRVRTPLILPAMLLAPSK
ncbi:Zinc finger MYM-type protein 1, partial [Caligus rogercresseyi]